MRYKFCKDCDIHLPCGDAAFQSFGSNWAPMLDMRLWQTICDDRLDILCFECAENRLCRKIERADLLPAEWNNLMHWNMPDLYVTQEELDAPWIDTWVD